MSIYKALDKSLNVLIYYCLTDYDLIHKIKIKVKSHRIKRKFDSIPLELCETVTIVKNIFYI